MHVTEHAGTKIMLLTLTDMFVLLQATANVIVFFCVNVVGVFMHNLMEHAQRKAFLDTRNCIAARLEMEDENEKLVSRLLLRNLWRDFESLCLWRDKT